jgi:hypothetical protein
VNAANPRALADTLAHERDRAFLFRNLATLRTDIPLFDSVDALRWKGPTPAFAPLGARFDAAVTDNIPRRAKVSRPERGVQSRQWKPAPVVESEAVAAFRKQPARDGEEDS